MKTIHSFLLKPRVLDLVTCYNWSVRIPLLSLVLHRVVALFVVNRRETYHFAECYSNYLYISYLIGSTSFWLFLEICELGVRENGAVFDYKSKKSQGVVREG